MVLHRSIPDLALFFAGFIAVAILTRWALQIQSKKPRSRVQIAVIIAAALVVSVVFAAAALTPNRIAYRFNSHFVTWTRALGIAGSACAIACVPIAWLWRRIGRTVPDRVDPQRRQLLLVARAATLAAPAVVTGFAIIRRNDLRMREVDIAIPALPDDLAGLRIVQLSDIHRSPFLSASDLDRAVAMANETKPHLAFVTGDLISRRGDPLDSCLDGLARLRADAGVWGCLGNHEIHAGSEQYTTVRGARLGMRFLRGENEVLRFGKAALNLAGVDYQRFNYPYLTGAEALLDPTMPNVLLTHNPDVFPVAANQGWDLTVAGHTHGGQVNFEILSADVNIMRFYTPYTYGLYTEGPASLFVTRGIGTVGVPARLGAPPEVALLRLVKA